MSSFPVYSGDLDEHLVLIQDKEAIDYVLGYLSHTGIPPTQHPYRSLLVELQKTGCGEWGDYSQVWGCHSATPTDNSRWFDLLS
jgi:hypothetical protein